MNEQIFRFTLNTVAFGPQVIREPLEWQTAPIKLERDTDYHSIFEFYDTPLTFTEIGMSYIKRVEALGVDYELDFLIEISEDGGVTWETFFNGLLDLETISELEWPTAYKIQISAMRNKLWTKFINRLDREIDMQSATDLDFVPRNVLTPVNQLLPNQIIRESFNGWLLNSVSFICTRFAGGNKYITVDYDGIGLDEIGGRVTVGDGVWADLASTPVMFRMTDAGNYNFSNITFESTFETHAITNFGVVTETYEDPNTFVSGGTVGLQFWFKLNDDIAIPFTITHNTSGGVHSAVYTNNIVKDLQVGDQIKIYGTVPLDLNALLDNQHYVNLIFWGKNLTNDWENIHPLDLGFGYFFEYAYQFDGSTASFTIPAAPSGSNDPSTINCLALTTFPDSVCQGFKAHEAAQTILDRIIGMDDSLYAPYLGDPHTQRATYGDTGCGAEYVILQGLQIRAFTLAAKPFSNSFNDWWGGFNPVLNLGLGTKVISGIEKIYIDKKSAFYDNSGDSLQLFNVMNVTRKYKTDLIYNAEVIGFNNWKSTTLSSIDDPQATHNYSAPPKFIGQSLSVISGYVAASFAFEFTRRQSINPQTAWTLDNNTFILESDLIVPSIWDPAVHYPVGAVVTYLTIPYIAIVANTARNPAASSGQWSVTSNNNYIARTKVNGAFPAVTNLNDPNLRYNKTLTPGRMFRRWLNVFNIGVQQYAQNPSAPVWTYGVSYAAGTIVQVVGSGFYIAIVGSINLPPNVYPSKWSPYGVYIFLTGEANVAMSCTIVIDACDGTDVATVTENANIPITTEVLKGIESISFTNPLNWSQYKTIRDNRQKSIGISTGPSGPKSFFIESIEYIVFSRSAKFVLTSKV